MARSFPLPVGVRREHMILRGKVQEVSDRVGLQPISSSRVGSVVGTAGAHAFPFERQEGRMPRVSERTQSRHGPGTRRVRVGLPAGCSQSWEFPETASKRSQASPSRARPGGIAAGDVILHRTWSSSGCRSKPASRVARIVSAHWRPMSGPAAACRRGASGRRSAPGTKSV